MAARQGHRLAQRCSLAVGNTSRDRFPEPECAIADGQHRGGNAPFAVAQQIGPHLGGPFGDRHRRGAEVVVSSIDRAGTTGLLPLTTTSDHGPKRSPTHDYARPSSTDSRPAATSSKPAPTLTDSPTPCEAETTPTNDVNIREHAHATDDYSDARIGEQPTPGLTTKANRRHLRPRVPAMQPIPTIHDEDRLRARHRRERDNALPKADNMIDQCLRPRSHR